MSIILGIDPGLAHTGWGVISADKNKFHYLAHGVINTKAKENVGTRLLHIHREVKKLVQQFNPQEAGIESLYFAKNITSAIPVAQARGVVLLAMAEDGIQAMEFAPQEIKQSLVGRGRADKVQIQEFVKLLLGLREVPKPDHAADALAAAICRYNHSLPEKAEAAIDEAQQNKKSFFPYNKKKRG